MKLIINGPVKPYYIQMLAMLFFPGEKFPEAELEADARSAALEVHFECDTAYASASVSSDGETSWAETVLARDGMSAERTAQLALGGAFFDACVRLTHHTPPWGMLTGVRPARLALELLTSGFDREGAIRYFEKLYKTSYEKARLAVLGAESSQRLITPERQSECSLYIAIPFCPTRCSYCSFVSYTSPKLLAMIPEYLELLREDIRHTLALIRSLGLRLASIYIGGGTPTVLNAHQLESLLSELCDASLGTDEFTLEAGRPDTIDAEKLAVAKKHGVTRVSVNTQTLNERVLKNIGRSHSTDDFFRAYETARETGFRNINVDLIAGLPGDTLESFVSSVDRVRELCPTDITVHTFSVKKSAEMKTEGLDVYDRDGSVAAECVRYSGEALMSAGYIPYYMYRQKNTVGNLENVGYSLAGHEGLYNIFMMDEVHSVFACGASSVTKLVGARPTGERVIKRLCEPKYPYEYLCSESEREEKRSKTEKEVRDFYSSFKI